MGWGDLSYYMYRLGGALAPRLPVRLGYWLAAQAGSVVYRLSPARSIVQDNMAHILGQSPRSPEVQRLARQVFRNQCKNYFDLLRVAALSREQILATVDRVRNIERLDAALARGHGVVLVSAHFGNFDLAGQVLALRGYKVTAIAEHLKPERLFQYVCRQRESHGLRFVPVDASLRPVFRALRANELVGSAIDRNVTDAGRLVEFFGSPARLPDGYLRLALRTGAALVPCFCRRLPDDRFDITIEAEVELERSGDHERDIRIAMPRVISLFESYLSRHPEQWVYFQPVWTHPPTQGAAEGAPSHQVEAEPKAGSAGEGAL
jgi:lauroyl/myristoyl acyltransferase